MSAVFVLLYVRSLLEILLFLKRNMTFRQFFFCKCEQDYVKEYILVKKNIWPLTKALFVCFHHTNIFQIINTNFYIK